MSLPTVLSLFDCSMNFVIPWARVGYPCICVDIQHPEGESTHPVHSNIKLVGVDIFEYLPPRTPCAFVAAWPPCTDLAVSGARWFAGKGLGKLSHAIKLFHRAAQICEWSGAPYLIENPVSVISTHWRKPDHTFHPWHYGDLTQKKTCLWTGGGFVMPSPIHTTKPDGVRESVWLMPPSPERANLRSETSTRFAEEVFFANETFMKSTPKPNSTARTS